MKNKYAVGTYMSHIAQEALDKNWKEIHESNNEILAYIINHNLEIFFNKKRDWYIMNISNKSIVSSGYLSETKAGWVITTEVSEQILFLNTADEWSPNGTNQDALFSSQDAAIAHIVNNRLRNCWTLFKMV